MRRVVPLCEPHRLRHGIAAIARLKCNGLFSSFESSDQISSTAPPPIEGTMTYFGMLPLLVYEQRHQGAMSHKYQNGLLMTTLTISLSLLAHCNPPQERGVSVIHPRTPAP